MGNLAERARAIEYYPGRKDRHTAPRRLVRLERNVVEDETAVGAA